MKRTSMVVNHASTMMVFWQVVELRTPAKEGSDALVSADLYYEWWCPSWYYSSANMRTCESGYTYSVYAENILWGYYQMSSVPGVLPIDIPPIFTMLECTQMAGPLCTGSGIPPNKTLPEGAPPLMIGAGPCELPFLVWQVDNSASYHSRPWNLPGCASCYCFSYSETKMSSYFIPAALDCVCFI